MERGIFIGQSEIRRWWIGGAALCAILGAMSFLFAAPIAATLPAPASQPSTQPATRPDPLATPAGAVMFMLDLIKHDDFTAAREVALQQTSVGDMRKRNAQLLHDFQDGKTMVELDSYRAGTVASVICQQNSAEGKPITIFPLFVVQRFDEWKVELGQPNLRRLTPGERDSLPMLQEWQKTRLEQLRATTRNAK